LAVYLIFKEGGVQTSNMQYYVRSTGKTNQENSPIKIGEDFTAVPSLLYGGRCWILKCKDESSR
jgi:hypothetical protein